MVGGAISGVASSAVAPAVTPFAMDLVEGFVYPWPPPPARARPADPALRISVTPSPRARPPTTHASPPPRYMTQHAPPHTHPAPPPPLPLSDPPRRRPPLSIHRIVRRSSTVCDQPPCRQGPACAVNSQPSPFPSPPLPRCPLTTAPLPRCPAPRSPPGGLCVVTVTARRPGRLCGCAAPGSRSSRPGASSDSRSTPGR